MVDVVLNGQGVTFKIKGFHKVLAMRGSIEVPLNHIVSVAASSWGEALSWEPGARVSGVHSPSGYATGTFRRGNDLYFVDTKDVASTISVELKDEEFHKLVIQVQDPQAAMAKLSRLTQQPAQQ